MITEKEWKRTSNSFCFLCKIDFKLYLESSTETYGIRCEQEDQVRNVWFCKKCWIEFAGEDNLFWDFSKEKL